MKYNNGSSRRMRPKRGGGRPFHNNGSNGGGHHQRHHGNQAQRAGNWRAQVDKYLQQAKDALSMGDHTLAENYFQHAEHFQRMLAELRPEEIPAAASQASFPDATTAAGPSSFLEPQPATAPIDVVAIGANLAEEELLEDQAQD